MKRVAVLSVLLTGALAGCNYEAPGPAVEQAVGSDVDAPRVTVKDAGTGDKRVLAYADIGKEQAVTVDVTSGFAQDVVKADRAADFETSSLDEKTTTLPLKGSVEEASEATDGQAEASRNVFFTVGVPEYSGNVRIDSAEGFQFGWRAVDSGQMSSLRLAAPQEGTDEARALAETAISTLVSLPVVFPDEEIGAGATWTVESRVVGGSPLLQTVTYTVDALTDTGAQLSVDVDQRPSLGALSLDAATQPSDAPSTASAGTLDVRSSDSQASGKLTVDLSQPLPVAGDVDVMTRVVYGQDGGEQPAVVQTTKTGLKFSPNAAD